MSDEDDPHAADDPPGSADEEDDLKRRRRELTQRERGLDDFADELDDREAHLDERDRELREKRTRLEEREAELDRREQRIEEREAELDDREVAIGERERELADRADELDRKEETIREYVGDSVRDTVEEAIAGASLNDDPPSRFGNVGSLVLGLVGITLVVGGVLNGVAEGLAWLPVVFASDTANLAVTVLLLFSGLAANLAAVAD